MGSSIIPPRREPEPLRPILPFFDHDSLLPIIAPPLHLGAVMLLFSVLCQYFTRFVLPCLISVALVHTTYALRKARKLYEAEKRTVAELEEELGKKTRAKDLPAGRRRSGKGGSKRARKAERKRRRAEKRAAMMEALEETHEKK